LKNKFFINQILLYINDTKMTEKHMRFYYNENVFEINQTNALEFELAVNIIAGNRRDEYGDNDEDYKLWFNISKSAYNLWKNNIGSEIEIKEHIFKMFPLKDWKEYTKYN